MESKMTNKTHIIHSGGHYKISPAQEFDVFSELPIQTYSVVYDERNDVFSLQKIENMSVPSKVYGDVTSTTKRILDTFGDRPHGTGVHLDGIKGSGKTLLAKKLSVEGLKLGYPTIIINQPFCGETFNKFMQSINVPAIILFDEFEKVYCDEAQARILTLFDGVYKTKKLFVITTNESYRVSQFLKNRPGRMYYSLKFDNLSPEFVREYCEDNLINQDRVEEFVRYVDMFRGINFDMMAAAVEEMNRYNESLRDVCKFLNVSPQTAFDMYDISISVNGGPDKVIQERKVVDDLESLEYSINSNQVKAYFKKEVDLDVRRNPENAELHDKYNEVVRKFFPENSWMTFDIDSLFEYDSNSGTFVYKRYGLEDSILLLKVKRREYGAVGGMESLIA